MELAIDLEKVFEEAAQQAGGILKRAMFLAGRVSQLEAELADVRSLLQKAEEQLGRQATGAQP